MTLFVYSPIPLLAFEAISEASPILVVVLEQELHQFLMVAIFFIYD